MEIKEIENNAKIVTRRRIELVKTINLQGLNIGVRFQKYG